MHTTIVDTLARDRSIAMFEYLPVPHITVIVPVAERPDPLADTYSNYAAVLKQANYTFEFLFVIHPSYDWMTGQITSLANTGEPVRAIHSVRPENETAMLRLAIPYARSKTIVTIPAYKQVEPQELPKLIKQVEDGADMAVGRRWPRNDSVINRIQSRSLTAVVGSLARSRGNTGGLHDVACGVRAIRQTVLKDIPLHGDFGRFLPLIALHRGYKVVEVDCKQHADDIHCRIYSPRVYLTRAVDILGLFFLLRFTDKPLRFFGVPGALLSLFSLLVLFAVFIEKLNGKAVADRPIFLLGVLLLSLGTQAIALGLIGEMIVHFNSTRRRTYRISSETA